MVEEAAGTLMYETKRVAAIKTHEKKQTKVDDLNAILAKEITPTLERRRGEKQNYLKWGKNNADIEHTERYIIPIELSKASKDLEHNMEGVVEMRKQMQSYQREEEAEIEDRPTKLTEEYTDRVKSTKLKEEKLAKDLVTLTSYWQNSQEVVKSAEDDLRSATQFATRHSILLNFGNLLGHFQYN